MRRRLPNDDEVDKVTFFSKIEKFMPEPEIWYIILALASACLELQKVDLYHGDIQPGNI